MTPKDLAEDLTESEPDLSDLLASAVQTRSAQGSELDRSVNQDAATEFKGAFWSIFFSTFITIFLAELGDKTQVATLLLSAESQSPVTVFLGAGLALVSTSLIGVLLGKWLAGRISEDALDTFAGVILLLITITLVGDILGV